MTTEQHINQNATGDDTRPPTDLRSPQSAETTESVRIGRFSLDLARIALAALARLPLGLLPVVACLSTVLILLFARRTVHIASRNIRLCQPSLSNRQQRQLLRASTYHTALTALQAPAIWRDKGRYVLTAIEGVSLINECIDDSRGAILIMPHLGNWEVLNHFLGSRYRLTHMFRPNNRSAINQVVQEQRAGTGTCFVEADASGVRAQLRQLHQGGVIGLMPDQEPEVHGGEFAPFFGHAALTSSLSIRLADRTGARIFMVTCVRHAAGFRIKCQPLASDNTSLNVSVLNAAITRLIGEYPEQYLWSYKRFRTRPAGEPAIYPIMRSRFFHLRRLVASTGRLISHHLSRRLRTRLSRIYGVMLNLTRDGTIARTNLAYCGASAGIANVRKTTSDSIFHSAMHRLRRAEIWHRSDSEIESLCQFIEGREHFHRDRQGAGCIVLTPRLGFPDLVLRDLSIHYSVNDVIELPSRAEAAEQKTRERVRHGIRCFDLSGPSRQRLMQRLSEGEVVAVSPDMQPRLRDGHFVDFFGIPALTTTAIPELIAQSQARTLMGVALANGNSFELHYLDCQIDPSAPDIAERIMRQLETVIRLNPDQYEWSYKRFNIRPAGQPKLYRHALLQGGAGRYTFAALAGK